MIITRVIKYAEDLLPHGLNESAAILSTRLRDSLKNPGYCYFKYWNTLASASPRIVLLF